MYLRVFKLDFKSKERLPLAAQRVYVVSLSPRPKHSWFASDRRDGIELWQSTLIQRLIVEERKFISQMRIFSRSLKAD